MSLVIARRALARLMLLGVVLSLAACETWPQKTSIPAQVPVSDVLNAVKDELNAFLAAKPTVASKGKLCAGRDGQQIVSVVPDTIKLTLKTVAANENAPSAGLGSPLGVLSFDPSYTGSYSKSNSQSLELNLKVPTGSPTQPVAPGDHALAKTIAGLRDELLKVDHDKSPCLNPSELKATVYFDVVNKTTGGVALKVAVFKLGDKITATDEYHQTLEIHFAMSGTTLIK